MAKRTKRAKTIITLDVTNVDAEKSNARPLPYIRQVQFSGPQTAANFGGPLRVGLWVVLNDDDFCITPRAYLQFGDANGYAPQCEVWRVRAECLEEELLEMCVVDVDLDGNPLEIECDEVLTRAMLGWEELRWMSQRGANNPPPNLPVALSEEADAAEDEDGDEEEDDADDAECEDDAEQDEEDEGEDEGEEEDFGYDDEEGGESEEESEDDDGDDVEGEDTVGGCLDDQLDDMDRPALAQLAKELKLKFTSKTTEAALRESLKEALMESAVEE